MVGQGKGMARCFKSSPPPVLKGFFNHLFPGLVLTAPLPGSTQGAPPIWAAMDSIPAPSAVQRHNRIGRCQGI